MEGSPPKEEAQDQVMLQKPGKPAKTIAKAITPSVRFALEDVEADMEQIGFNLNPSAENQTPKPINIQLPVEGGGPVDCNMFVANRYVRKMFREMKMLQEEKYQALSDQVENNVAKLAGFLEIADVSFPRVQAEAATACE